MMGRSHMIVGAVAGAAISTPETLLIAVTCSAIGSLFPDIDTQTSTISRRFPLFIFSFCI